jgi:hypothetical protein
MKEWFGVAVIAAFFYALFRLGTIWGAEDARIARSCERVGGRWDGKTQACIDARIYLDAGSQ